MIGICKPVVTGEKKGKLQCTVGEEQLQNKMADGMCRKVVIIKPERAKESMFSDAVGQPVELGKKITAARLDKSLNKRPTSRCRENLTAWRRAMAAKLSGHGTRTRGPFLMRDWADFDAPKI
ncbi:MAG: hypothetical protein IJ083_13560 [Clostridia bacterium]|nr:hypothetical protein [Clostridia bacterium]